MSIPFHFFIRQLVFIHRHSCQQSFLSQKKKLKALSHGHYRAVQCGPKHDMFSQHKHKKHDKSLLPWLVCLGEAGESYHSLR